VLPPELLPELVPELPDELLEGVDTDEFEGALVLLDVLLEGSE